MAFVPPEVAQADLSSESFVPPEAKDEDGFVPPEALAGKMDISAIASSATEVAARTLGLGATPQELVTASTTPMKPLQAVKEDVQNLAPTEEQITSEAEKTGQIPTGKIAGRVAADTAASLIPTTVADFAMIASFPALKAALIKRFPILGRELGSLFSKTPSVNIASASEQPIARTSEDQFIDQINPRKKILTESDRPTIYQADIEGMAPENALKIEPSLKTSLGQVDFVKDPDTGSIYAKVKGKEVGYISAMGEGTDLSVAKEFQRQGIGTELYKRYLVENPNAPSGGFTPAGEATARRAFRESQSQIIPSSIRDATRTQMAQEVLAKVAPQPEPFQSGVSEKTIGNLVDQIQTLKDSPIATDTSKRAFERIMDLIQTGEISETHLADVAQKNGIQPVELAAMVGEEFSRSGRMLNKASQMVKALNAAFEGNPEAMAALSKIKPPEPTAWQMISEKIRSVESMRRRFLVSQLATTARNISTQAPRYVLQGVDDALTGAVQVFTGKTPPKQAFANALEDVMVVGRTMTQGSRRASLSILNQFPTEATRLLGTPVGDVALTGKIVDVLNAANTAQEYFFRRMMVDARIMGYLRGQGANIGIGADLSNLPKIPESKISQFVGDALETTFAKTPGRGSFTDAILQTYNRLPFLTALGNPFPRFWSNSMEFLFQHSPLGFTRLFGPAMRMAIASGDTRAASQAVSRAMLGSTMLGLGYALREGPWAGPRWYQVQMGNGKMLDIRPFAPFSTYAFLAEAIREAQGKPVQMTPYDYFTGLVGINRISGSGLVVVDAMRAKDWQGVGKFIKSFAGEWAGSFATPVQIVQDILGDIPGAWGQRERTLRSSREDLLTGPFRRNIPGMSQTLPAQPSAYEPSPVVPPQGRGVLRQTTGASIRNYTPLEMAAEHLGIRFQDVSPKTGDPMTDRLVLEKMGQLSQKIGPGILNVIKNFPDPEEGKAIFLQFMTEIKRAATEQVMSESQKFAMDRKIKSQHGLKRILFQRELEKKTVDQ